MERAFIVLVLGLSVSISSAPAKESSLLIEAECRSISESDPHGCACLGHYFMTKFGPDEGTVAMHLVQRSFVPEPQISASALYERFGADRLNEVAWKILETHDEAVSACPISAHIAE